MKGKIIMKKNIEKKLSVMKNARKSTAQKVHETTQQLVVPTAFVPKPRVVYRDKQFTARDIRLLQYDAAEKHDYVTAYHIEILLRLIFGDDNDITANEIAHGLFEMNASQTVGSWRLVRTDDTVVLQHEYTVPPTASELEDYCGDDPDYECSTTGSDRYIIGKLNTSRKEMVYDLTHAGMWVNRRLAKALR
jgi:hypothetical protein